MKIKRFNTINVLLGSKLETVDIPDYDKGAYIVDRSKFTPVSELAKSVIGQSIGKTDLSRYDFADGKDNGMSVPVARRRPELAELSVDVRRQQEHVKQAVGELQKYQEFKKLTQGEVSSESSSKDR